MTEAEIMKALECCVSITTSEACDGCPLNTKDGCETHSFLLESLSLDLINRKNDEIKQKDDEIDCLNKAIQVHQDYEIKKARAEAIKEFAERVKERYFYWDLISRKYYPCIDLTQDYIDQIAKEMGVEL